MPPKKKKGSKKSGKKSSSKKSEKDAIIENLQNAEIELNEDFFILHIKDLERKLRLYKEKFKNYTAINEEFMKKQKELSQEKHDLISFLEKNLLNRSDELSDLKDRYCGLQQAKEVEKTQFESTLQEIRSKLQESKDQLTSENSLLSSKLSALEEFRNQKEKYLEEYSELEKILIQKKAEHQVILETIQERSSQDHDRLKKDIVTKINSVAAEFRKISQKQTSETTKRTIRENVSIRTQLIKMDDKNIEMMQENEQMKTKVKSSLNRIRDLEKINTNLAGKNISHKKLINLLMDKHQEHQLVIQDYQKESDIIQQMNEENEKLDDELYHLRSEINDFEKWNESIECETFYYESKLEEIKTKTDQSQSGLINAIHCLKELLQYIPQRITLVSSKSTFTSSSSSSKRGSTKTMPVEFSAVDTKEWGTFEQRVIEEAKLCKLLECLDLEGFSSRASSVSDIKKTNDVVMEDELRKSPSISIGSTIASKYKRISPIQQKREKQIKILSDYEIKIQSKRNDEQLKKGFYVPGLLQMVPHMNRHISTSLEKTQQLNKRLIGINSYSSEDDCEKPIKYNLLQPLDQSKLKSLASKLSV